MIVKSKRHSSNSRSKSKGSKQHARQQSAEHHRHKEYTSSELKAKVKTENSVHRKTPVNLAETKDHKQKLRLRSGKNGLDGKSQQQSDREARSMSKKNKTEEGFEEDLEGRVDELRKALSNIGNPSPEVASLRAYFRQIQRTLKFSSQPLCSLLEQLHSMYTAPLERLFEIVLPFEALLQKRDQLSRQVEQQLRENERLKIATFEQQNEEIFKLKDRIEKQRRILDDKREVFDRFERWKGETYKKQVQGLPRLEIEGLHGKVESYYDEFKKHIQKEQCSESWRLQFQREQQRFDPV